MAGNERRTVAQVRWGFGLAGSMLIAFSTACRPPEPDTLAIAERIPVHPSAASVHFHEPLGFWIGAPGELFRLDRSGVELDRVAIGDPDVPRVVGGYGELVLLRAGGSAVVLEASAARLLAERPDMGGILALDPSGRYVFHTTGAGAITVHEAGTLDPLRGWAAIGAPSTALTVTTEGDRVIQALAANDERPPELLVRDLQTGRAISRLPFVEPLDELVSGRDGSIFALVGRGRVAGGVIRLGWNDGALTPRWRRSFADLGVGGAEALVVSTVGDRIAVIATENGAGLLVLDVETGRTVERLRGDPLDVTFDADDRIYLLHPGELRRVEPSSQ
jgi:hypothetical protein